MGYQSVLVFTCDRCGVQERADQAQSPGWQPSLWRGVSVVTPPLSAFNEKGAKRFLLCLRCGTDCLRWMTEAPVSEGAVSP